MIFETKNFFVTIFLNEILIKNVKTITDVTRKRYETTNIRRATMNASLCEFLFDSNLRQTVLAIIKYLLRYICTKNCSHYWTNRCISKGVQPVWIIWYDSYFSGKTKNVIIRCRILKNELWLKVFKSSLTSLSRQFNFTFLLLSSAGLPECSTSFSPRLRLPPETWKNRHWKLLNF